MAPLPPYSYPHHRSRKVGGQASAPPNVWIGGKGGGSGVAGMALAIPSTSMVGLSHTKKSSAARARYSAGDACVMLAHSTQSMRARVCAYRSEN